MEFHETVRGKVFFEHQLPELIKTLKCLTDAMEASAGDSGLKKAKMNPSGKVHLPREVSEALRNVLDSETQMEEFSNLLFRDIMSDTELKRKFATCIGRAVVNGCEREEHNCDACCDNGRCTQQGMDGKPRWQEEE